MPHLCKDCIYCRPYEQGRDEVKRYELATCDKLSTGEISLVDGSQRRQDRFCENERRSLVGECGPQGKLFHPIGQPLTEQVDACPHGEPIGSCLACDQDLGAWIGGEVRVFGRAR